MAQPKLSQNNMNRIKIPVPDDLETQKTLVAEIETLENKIAVAQKIIDEAAAKKQAVLKNYL
jgi:restriction endonuclease S subunit